MRPQSLAGPVSEVLPPARWWRDPQISLAVNPSIDQISRLDAIEDQHTADIERSRQEAANALRDFRLMLNAEQPSASDITAAGQRLREARDRLLDAEVATVAQERVVLTQQQWQTLQRQLQDMRRGDDQRGRGPGGYGRGRGGGRRRPPF